MGWGGGGGVGGGVGGLFERYRHTVLKLFTHIR